MSDHAEKPSADMSWNTRDNHEASWVWPDLDLSMTSMTTGEDTKIELEPETGSELSLSVLEDRSWTPKEISDRSIAP